MLFHLKNDYTVGWIWKRNVTKLRRLEVLERLEGHWELQKLNKQNTSCLYYLFLFCFLSKLILLFQEENYKKTKLWFSYKGNFQALTKVIMASPQAIYLWYLHYETVTFLTGTVTLGRSERFSSIKGLIIVHVLHLVGVIMHIGRKYASTKAGEKQMRYWGKI